MSEGLVFPNDSSETGEFDMVIDQVVPVNSLPLPYQGTTFLATPENTRLRLFGDGLEGYNRAIVEIHGETFPFKPEDDLLKGMRMGGFPADRPLKLDETDREFMAGFALMSSDEGPWPSDFL